MWLFLVPPGTPITHGVTTTSDLSILTINAPDASAAGKYVCHAENSFGPVDSETHVNFSCKYFLLLSLDALALNSSLFIYFLVGLTNCFTSAFSFEFSQS